MERRDWVIHTLGTDAPAPYAMGRSICPQASHVIYNAAGGVDLDQATPEHRAAVLAELKAADALTVRDRRTQALLAAGGVPAGVIPDPAVMTAELFGARIRRLFTTDEPARIAQRFPQGHVAVQLSADFGDDATLGRIAGQLNRIADWTGYGIVLFRAGGAPWHDDAGRLERLAAQINPAKVALYPSLDIWKICALIAQSRACCTSSLHGRIVALSFAVPHINVRLPASPAGASSGPASKQAAFVETWESEETREPAETSTSDAVAGVPACVAIADIAEHLHTVLEMSPQRLQRIAMRLADEYRRGFAALCAPFTGTP